VSNSRASEAGEAEKSLRTDAIVNRDLMFYCDVRLSELVFHVRESNRYFNGNEAFFGAAGGRCNIETRKSTS
jgi:hypothetical protein